MDVDKKTNKTELTTRSRSARTVYHRRHNQIVTPFECQPKAAVSPRCRRMDQSPLQVPLALAIQQIAAQHFIIQNQRMETASNGCVKRLDWQMKPKESSKAIQNLKNILQEFAQSLYTQFQSSLYSTFNVQMKRLILKYRQTQRMLKKVKEQLVNHADIFEYNKKHQTELQLKEHQRKQLQKAKRQIEGLLEQEKRGKDCLKSENEGLKRQNVRLQGLVERFEQIMIAKLSQQAQIQAPKLIRPLTNPKDSPQNHTFTSLLRLKSTQSIPSACQTQNPKPSSETVVIDRQTQITQFNFEPSNINQLCPTLSPVRKKRGPRSTLGNPKQCILMGQLIER